MIKSFFDFTMLKLFPERFFTRKYYKESFINIGEYTYGKPKLYFWSADTKLTIGKFCSIADNVRIIMGGNHRIDWISTYPFKEFSHIFSNGKNIEGHPSTKGNISIGNDVWIANDVTILSGITIGDGAVIGTGTVVSKSIEPYEIVIGNPMVKIKKRFSDEQIELLLKIKWWNWPKEQINDCIQLLSSENFDELVDYYDNKINNVKR